jgi:hypothetical protein
MAEAIVNHDLAGLWKAFSAGTAPTGNVHPLGLKALAEIGILHQGSSKSVDVFRSQAEKMVVFRQVRDAMHTAVSNPGRFCIKRARHPELVTPAAAQPPGSRGKPA